MTDPVRTVLVDDHPLFRGGVARTLAEAGFEILAEGGSAAEAVELAGLHLPDLMLVDISMPGGGIAAAREVSRRYPAVLIVMLTVSEADEDVLAALEAGARGYVLKGVGAQELVALLREIISGGSYVSPALAARMLSAMQRLQKSGHERDDPLIGLTKREEEILRLVAQGRSNKEIGRELDLQEKTVKHYMTNILQKLQVRNRVEAAVLARSRGL